MHLQPTKINDRAVSLLPTACSFSVQFQKSGDQFFLSFFTVYDLPPYVHYYDLPLLDQLIYTQLLYEQVNTHVRKFVIFLLTQITQKHYLVYRHRVILLPA